MAGTPHVQVSRLKSLDEMNPGRESTKGLRQFLPPEEQRDWAEGKAKLTDTEGRSRTARSSRLRGVLPF